MTEILFFDAAGTLFELTESVGWHYAVVAKEFGLALEPDALNRAFREAWKNARPPELSSGSREDDDRGWWQALVEDVFAQVNAPFSEEYFDRVYRHFLQPGVWRLFSETSEVLETLAPKYRLGIISNFDSRLYQILENLGIRRFFDPIIVSSEVGVDKPHPQIFTRALEIAGVTAPSAWHIGDDEEADWQGARSSGLHVFELRRPEKNLSDLIHLLASNL